MQYCIMCGQQEPQRKKQVVPPSQRSATEIHSADCLIDFVAHSFLGLNSVLIGKLFCAFMTGWMTKVAVNVVLILGS